MSAQLALPQKLAPEMAPTTAARRPWEQRAAPGRAAGDGGLSAAGSVLHFAQDREIYGEGDAARLFFKVTSGVVRTCKFLGDGRRQIEAFHVTGDVFGFEAGEDYRLTAEAVCDCTVIAYCRREIERQATTSGALSQQLYAYALRSMRRAQDHSLLLGHRSALEKVAAFLTEWAQRSPASATITLAMTRQDIADYLGLTIETVSRTFSQLERDAVIALSTARQIRVRNPAALRAEEN
jgi:CRP/FNR family transcriptional regulator, nitrogen fixation regulation protein